jgi:LysR family transcriptional regulator for metE and metH
LDLREKFDIFPAIMNTFHHLLPTPDRLTLAHYRAVQAIAAHGSITAAADALGTTQSALSHQLREAERRLDVSLFRRIGKRLRPSPAGERIASAAEAHLPALRSAEADAAGYAGVPRHRVRIGSGAYSCYRWLPAALERFQAERPDVDIRIVGDTTREPGSALLAGTLDVAIGLGPLPSADVRAVPLFRDELVMIVPPGHPIAAKAYVEPSDVADVTYMTYSDVEQKGYEAERFLRPAGVFPRRMVTIELTEGICELVAAGFGVSILSRWAVAPYVHDGRLVARRVGAEGLFIDWHAAVRASDPADSPANRLARALADSLRDGAAIASSQTATTSRADPARSTRSHAHTRP